MSFGAAVKNKFIETAALAADSKLDGRDVGTSLRQQIAGQTNAVSSRKIARGPITNFLFEVLEGLWENDLTALSTEMERRSAGVKSAARPVVQESKKSTNVSPGNTSTR